MTPFEEAVEGCGRSVEEDVFCCQVLWAMKLLIDLCNIDAAVCQ
jgi:hypothetical protein